MSRIFAVASRAAGRIIAGLRCRGIGDRKVVVVGIAVSARRNRNCAAKQDDFVSPAIGAAIDILMPDCAIIAIGDIIEFEVGRESVERIPLQGSRG